MSEHVPVLQVALPLIAAPLCLFLRDARLVRGFAALVALVCLGLSLHTLGVVLEHGILSYWVGGWAPPLGLELRRELGVVLDGQLEAAAWEHGLLLLIVELGHEDVP